MANTNKAIVLDLNTENTKKSIKDLRKEMKALKDEMANVEEGSDEFYAIADAAGALNHQLLEINQTVRGAGADFGDLLSNGMKTTQGLIGGFQSVTATMSLMGIESEGVEKALTKMTALLNIQQGLSAIDEGVKSFKKLRTAVLAASSGMSTLKKALISTGLGALVVLVGTLAANWDKVSEKLGLVNNVAEKNKRRMDELTESYKKFNAEQSKLSDANDYELELMKIQGKSEDEIEKKRFDNLNKRRDSIKEELEGIKATIEANKGYIKQWEHVNSRQEERNGLIKQNNELIKQQDELTKQLNKTTYDLYTSANKIKYSGNTTTSTTSTTTKDDWESEYEALKKRYNDGYQIVQASYDEQAELLDKLLKDKKISQEDYNEWLLKAQEKLNEDIAKLDNDSNNKLLNERNVARENELQSLSNDIRKRQAVEAQRFINGEIKYNEYVKNLEKLDAEYLESYINTLQAQLTADGITADERLEIERQLNDAKIQLANNGEPTESGITSIDAMTLAIRNVQQALSDLGVDSSWGNILSRIGELAANWDTLSKNMKGGTKQMASAILTITSAGFGAIGDMMTALGNSYDESTKEGFEANKKYQIAATTMNMLGGIVSSWASALLPSNGELSIWGQIAIGAALSTMVAALGTVQLSKIKNTQFEGGGSAISNGGGLGLSSNILSQITQTQTTPAYLTGGKVDNELNASVSITEIERVKNRVHVVENESVF